MKQKTYALPKNTENCHRTEKFENLTLKTVDEFLSSYHVEPLKPKPTNLFTYHPIWNPVYCFANLHLTEIIKKIDSKIGNAGIHFSLQWM